jgi:predicted hydrocarbon binding protein
MLNAVKTLRKYGKERALELLSPKLHKYLNDRILVSLWYPEEDQLELIRVLVQILSTTPGIPKDLDVYVLMGRDVAQNDMDKLYGKMLHKGDIDETLKFISSLWGLYHDTGSMTTTIIGPGHGRVELVNYGMPSTEMCRIQIGWITELVSLAGATDVHMVETQCHARGAQSCIWDLRWK